MPVTGDFAALRDLQKRLERIAGGRFAPELAQRLGAVGMKLVADEFRESRDPYGKPWAPVQRNRAKDRKARARRAAAGKPAKADKPLIDTGRLRASVTAARTSGSTVRITLPVSYASFHQTGTKRIQRRQILPEHATGGLGPRWTAAFNREASRMLQELASGRRR